MTSSDLESTTISDIEIDPLKPGLFSDICDVATEGIYAVDRNRCVVYWNPAAERISGYDPRYVIGRRCADGMLRHCDASGNVLCGDGCPLLATIADGQSRTADVFLLHRQGRRIPVRIRAEAIRRDGEIVGCVEFFHDMTQPLTILEELKEARTREKLDPLTGLGNRRLIEEALRAHYADGTSSRPAGVIFLDIDRLKQVNDTYGHAFGDQVIREIGLTIAGELRSTDVVGRWGGEEFVVLAPNVDAGEVERMASRIRSLVSAIEVPHERGTFLPTISAGATVTRAGEEPHLAIERADRLMYTSKERGRNQITVG